MAHRGVGIVSKSKMDSLKSPINRDRLEGSIKAVLENLKVLNKDNQILDPVNEICLSVTMHKRISHGLVSTFKLPHPFYDKSTEICVFTKDISVKDPDKTIEYYERRFKKLGLPIKFIPFVSLKRDYKTSESRRFLAQSFSIYLVEARLGKYISRYLGPEFYTTPAAKRIRMVDFDHESIFTIFNRTLKSAFWNRSDRERWQLSCKNLLTPACENICRTPEIEGSTFLEQNHDDAGVERYTKIYVAPSTFSIDQIVDNLEACIKGVAFSTMRGWDNVRYLHVCSYNTLNYPIYANEDVNEELECLEYRELVRQYKHKRDKMKGDTLYTMSDQEIHGMLLQRLNTLKASAKPPKRKKLKLSTELLEDATVSVDEDAEDEHEVEEEYAEESGDENLDDDE